MYILIYTYIYTYIYIYMYIHIPETIIVNQSLGKIVKTCDTVANSTCTTSSRYGRTNKRTSGPTNARSKGLAQLLRGCCSVLIWQIVHKSEVCERSHFGTGAQDEIFFRGYHEVAASSSSSSCHRTAPCLRR